MTPMRPFDRSLPMALLRAREITMSFFRPLLLRQGLTEQQWRVIRVLREHGELEFNELAGICWIQPASLSGILTRLAAAALVKRSRSQIDQRRLHVSLTPQGTRRFEAVASQSEAQYREIERQLGRRRLQAMMSMLRDFERLRPPETADTLHGLTRPRSAERAERRLARATTRRSVPAAGGGRG